MKLPVHFKVIHLLFISVIFFFSASLAFGQTNLNQRDSKGRKQGKWVYLGKDRPTEGYPENGKVEEGSYKDDRKEGIWIKYYQDGITPKLKGEYHNNRPEGAYVKLDAKGTIIEAGNFTKGKYRDSLIRYHANGVVSYQG
ncbi:MAG TPA: hypothetical protein VKZ44_06690, partial [Taishania sp.]|nr:hypothetical protein [Taishania sp.]